MAHEIDLSKYEVRTDLLIESLNDSRLGKIDTKTRNIDDICVTEIIISDENSKYCNKKPGKYITITFEDVTDSTNQDKVEKVFTKELTNFLKYMNITSNAKTLVIGLGNAQSTPDSLGPKVADSIIITKHLFDIDGIDVLEGYRNVSCFKPSVLALTGIETKDSITGIIKQTRPDFTIIIDALASSSIDRVNKTIQLTDSGIFPGSGVGNSRGELSINTLGIPVLAIGIPTVVDAVTIVSDTINYLMKKFSYSKKNINNAKNKLRPVTAINYLKEPNTSLTNEDKKRLLGEIGGLSDEEMRQLIFEVLTPIGYNMMVTPKEVDFLIEKLSRILSNGINKSLHQNITNL